MRTLLVLLFLSLLGSCGYNRLHLSKVGPKKVIDVKHQDIEKRSDLSVTSLEEVSTIQNLAPEHIPVEIESNDQTLDEDETGNIEELYKPDPKDTVRLDSEDAAALEEALISEIRARRSKNLFITTLATMLLVIIPFAFIFFLGFYVAGLITYSKANRSRYITAEGDRYLRQAKTLLILASVFVGLFLIGSAFIIIIFFL